MVRQDKKPPPLDEIALIRVETEEFWQSWALQREIIYWRTIVFLALCFIVLVVFSVQNSILLLKYRIQHEKDAEDLRSIAFHNAANQEIFTEKPCQKRIVGYFTDFETSEIKKDQLEKLTHAVFAFIRMNWDGTIAFKNEKAKQRFLNLVSKSMKTNTKVMISIGGDDNSQYFSSVAADSRKRKRFTKSITSFVHNYRINGVDIHWKDAKEEDRKHYILLLKDLRARMRRVNKTHTVSVTVNAPGNDNTGMEYHQIIDHVEFINVVSMDNYETGSNEFSASFGPIAPLYSGEKEKNKFNVDSIMQYYVCKTKQPSKINMVIPFFGKSWEVVRESEKGRNVTLRNKKKALNPNLSKTSLEQDGWSLSRAEFDEESKSSYIYNHGKGMYLTFETERSLTAKQDYVKEKNLGGVWIWSVDMDDDRNSLLNAISTKDFCLGGGQEDEVKYKC